MNSLGFDKHCKDTKVVVAMSGGVDSSVAAVMLKKEGYDVTGITMNLYSQTAKQSNKSCCAGKDIADAREVANKYDIPHFILNYQEKFFDSVIDNFVETYSEGKTPVPCIKCNQTVKFHDMLNEAKKMNADTLVTGHYVRRVGGQSDAKLFKAKDDSKDQSYFLFATLKEQLDYVRFPLGDYLKSEIREKAKNYKLKVSDKPDSQDICFVSSTSYRDLINKLKPELNVEGNFINFDGKIIGKHKGIANYTVGQRKGLGVGGNDSALYVIDIDKKSNQITLGNQKLLKKTAVLLDNINWLDENMPKNNLKCFAKIRSTQKESSGTLKINSNQAEFIFDNEINATSPGQACVFYLNNQVLGGGWVIKRNS
tara:strand:+ start:730 stop:1833 length:1104 start_codon:yes stop_codon:yes gene_type:complete